MNYNLFSPLKNIYEHSDNELANVDEMLIEQASTQQREGTEHNLVDSVDEIIDTRDDVIEEKETDIDEQTEDNQGIKYLILLFALYIYN